MHSPTTNILNSIQALKSKLRSDHQQLQCIRKQFYLPPTKQLPEQQQDVSLRVRDKYRSEDSLDKTARQKMLQLRKKHQVEVNRMKEEFADEKAMIIEQYECKIKENQEDNQKRIREQEDYIAILENQVCQKTERDRQQEQVQPQGSPDSQIGRECQCHAKYQHIINSLIEENSILIQAMERKYRQLDEKPHKSNPPQPPKATNRNRLKFSKAESVPKNSRSIQRHSLRTVNNGQHLQDKSRIYQPSWQDSKQNIDANSMSSYWDDDQILSDEMKLRTIKHFWNAPNSISVKEIR